MRDKIDTNYGWLRVAKTRPVRHEWSDRNQTTLAIAIKPLKTNLALMVRPISSWLTMTTYLMEGEE